MADNSKPKWSTIKPKLTTLKTPELIELIKGMFEQSNDNKLFLTARLSPESIGEEALEPFRKRIIVQFYPSRGFGKLNLREARQAIRDYRKATSDLTGTLELMMTYLENGTEFTREFGDINEAFYNSLVSVLDEVAEILKPPDGERLYFEFSTRLEELKAAASHIGWGYGNEVREIVNRLATIWEEPQK